MINIHFMLQIRWSFSIFVLTFPMITSSLSAQTYPYAERTNNKLTVVLSQSTDGLNCLENCTIVIEEFQTQMEDAGNNSFCSYVKDDVDRSQTITIFISGPKIIPKKVKVKLRGLINHQKSITVEPKKYR